MKGAVAAGDRLTAEAAAEVLRAGGNAFDAAVAAAFASPMCEPALTSAGGGGFLLAVSPDQPPVLYDFFVDVPPKRIDNPNFYPVTIDFGDAKQVFHIGAGSVAVPGFVAGLLRVHSERGRLPLKEVLSPALSYARRGVYLSP
ncbi:MAG: gamma-glutamyltransferase, partial [Desulfurobacteriaceae bacterium]